jgi:hypothetical protein
MILYPVHKHTKYHRFQLSEIRWETEEIHEAEILVVLGIGNTGTETMLKTNSKPDLNGLQILRLQIDMYFPAPGSAFGWKDTRHKQAT